MTTSICPTYITAACCAVLIWHEPLQAVSTAYSPPLEWRQPPQRLLLHSSASLCRWESYEESEVPVSGEVPLRGDCPVASVAIEAASSLPRARTSGNTGFSAALPKLSYIARTPDVKQAWYSHGDVNHCVGNVQGVARAPRDRLLSAAMSAF